MGVEHTGQPNPSRSWSRVEQSGAEWCRIELGEAEWSRVEQGGARVQGSQLQKRM
jgi:hypothetical protein